MQAEQFGLHRVVHTALCNSEPSQTERIFQFVQENSADSSCYDKIPIVRVRLGREELLSLYIDLPALRLYTK